MDLQQFLSWTLNEHSAMLYIDQILMLSAHLYIVDTTSFVLNISWILMHSRLSLSHIFHFHVTLFILSLNMLIEKICLCSHKNNNITNQHFKSGCTLFLSFNSTDDNRPCYILKQPSIISLCLSLPILPLMFPDVLQCISLHYVTKIQLVSLSYSWI